jgi:hypothetical protein
MAGAGEVLAAVLVGIAALWLVLEPLLRPRTSRARMDEPLDLEETPKGIALAALKEIEFDRETGKLSDADYVFLKSRYTTEALEALRTEEAVRTDDVEALIAAKVRSLRSPSASTSPGTSSPSTVQPSGFTATISCPACGPRPEHDALFCSSCGGNLDSSIACGRCGAAIVPGARFCEACGRPVAA